MRKKSVFIFVSVIFLCCLCSGCGTTYECSKCKDTVREAYYNPFETDKYFCEDCAKAYFAPFPYSAYRVE